MHQSVQDRGSHGVIPEVFAPVLHHPVGSHQDAAPLFVTLMYQLLALIEN